MATIVAGPLAGALFATIAGAVWKFEGCWTALQAAQISIWLNLWNLAPVCVLDGGRLARLAAIPTLLAIGLSIPLIYQHWWLALALPTVWLSDQVIKAPTGRRDRAAVRVIAIGGALLTLVWLLTLQAILPSPGV